jgi:hypothetical protein
MVLWVARLALLSAVVAAVMLARARRDHRVFAVALVWVASVDGLRVALETSFGLLRPLESPPFTGAVRVAFHIDEAIGLSAPAATAIVTMVLFVRRRWLALLPGLAWAGAVAYLATYYPAIRGESLRLVYLGAELAALAVAAASIVTWGWRREFPTPAQACALFVCLVDGGLLLAGAQRWGFWSRWDLQQYACSLLYLTLAAYQVLSWKSLSPSQ